MSGSPLNPEYTSCVAIDCEMVGTGPGGKTSELARCTVVSYDGDVIYDKYIHPELPVVDYRTPWSGITHRHMENATPFKVAQGEVSMGPENQSLHIIILLLFTAGVPKLRPGGRMQPIEANYPAPMAEGGWAK
uniref:Exonuclease domain-containing protein n=1 Tax=Anolis carolinensis TaxID=28377 RepID=H9GKD7_ANOCA